MITELNVLSFGQCGLVYELSACSGLKKQVWYRVSKLLLFILLTHGTMSYTVGIRHLLPRPTLGDYGSTMSVCFYLFFNFSLVHAIVKQTCVLSSTPQNEFVRKLALSVPRTQRCNAQFGHQTGNFITSSVL